MKIGDIIRKNGGMYAEAAIWCNENAAKIREIEADQAGRRFIIEKNEESDEEKKAATINALKFYLLKTDWIVVKISEKSLTKEEKGVDEDLKKYADILAERARARERINELEGDVK